MRQWTVDAFASAPFKGNPACVVEPFDAWPESGWMQALAAENNQAETAFLLKTAEPGRFGLRWMTPVHEVELCGHATLASAHVLFSELAVDAASLTFDTRSGPLTVARDGAGYEMDFPARTFRRIEALPGMAEAIGAEPIETWAAMYPVVVLANETAVRNLKPDLSQIAPLSAGAECERGCLLVAAQADAGSAFDVVSRFFAPAAGIPEDPTTGSAHCILGPLFAEKLGKTTLNCHQAYPGRGGDVGVEVRGDRVGLRGTAVTVIESLLRV